MLVVKVGKTSRYTVGKGSPDASIHETISEHDCLFFCQQINHNLLHQ